jgi:hypothetical protein
LDAKLNLSEFRDFDRKYATKIDEPKAENVPRQKLKARIARFRNRRKPAIVVASMGRAGSTLVFTALRDASFGRPTEPFLVDLEGATLEAGMVYKTHDFPEGLRNHTNVRAVFLFGSASDSAKSVYLQEQKLGRQWIDRHFAHLHTDQPFEELFERDVLRIGDQLEAWTNCDHTPVLGVHFDAIWDNVDRIRNFTGLDLVLPQRRERQAKILPPGLQAKSERTYGTLDARIDKMPKVFVSGPSLT